MDTVRGGATPAVDVVRGMRLLVVVTVGVASLVACESSGPGTDDVADGEDLPTTPTDPADAQPDWIQDLSPAPDAQTSGAAVVDVKLELTTRNREARLEVDGVDVTAQAVEQPPSRSEAQVLTPDRLVYDPERIDQPLVDLDPGRHVATVRLLDFTDPESGDATEIGSFTWVFEVL